MKAIDLSRWELRLPFSEQREFDPLAMLRDDKGAPVSENVWFEDDGAITFRVPSAGNDGMISVCELREFDDRVGARRWNTSNGGYLSASLCVNEAPKLPSGKSERITVGRILGSDRQMCALFYDAGRIYFVDGANLYNPLVLHSTSGAEPHIPLGERFDFFLRVTLGELAISVIYNGVTYAASHDLDHSWLGQHLHFSVGVGILRHSIGPASASFYAISEPFLEPLDTSHIDLDVDVAPGGAGAHEVVAARIVLTLGNGDEIEMPMGWNTLKH